MRRPSPRHLRRVPRRSVRSHRRFRHRSSQAHAEPRLRRRPQHQRRRRSSRRYQRLNRRQHRPCRHRSSLRRLRLCLRRSNQRRCPHLNPQHRRPRLRRRSLSPDTGTGRTSDAGSGASTGAAELELARHSVRRSPIKTGERRTRTRMPRRPLEGNAAVFALTERKEHTNMKPRTRFASGSTRTRRRRRASTPPHSRTAK